MARAVGCGLMLGLGLWAVGSGSGCGLGPVCLYIVVLICTRHTRTSSHLPRGIFVSSFRKLEHVLVFRTLEHVSERKTGVHGSSRQTGSARMASAAASAGRDFMRAIFSTPSQTAGSPRRAPNWSYNCCKFNC